MTPARLRQRGQGLVEYALILGLVVVVVIAVLALQGRQIGNVFRDVWTTLQGP
jgi:pilus assembly protein Flp/PilA